jgi:hypothetical protein
MCERPRAGTFCRAGSTDQHEEDAMKMLLATLAVGGAVAAATALPATGQEAPPSKTLTLTSVQAKGGERAIDTPPRGDSVGDRSSSPRPCAPRASSSAAWRATASPST